MIKDSYQVFLDDFNINKKDLYAWGISSTIFPDLNKVCVAWEDLKKRVSSNQTVYIRGYGRDAHGTQLYQNLYRTIFNNDNVKKDDTNNNIPQKHIQKLTGLGRNKDVYNYQVSHIWGRTKNVFMFEAPWNICYTPKLIDPFTGHETKGCWPEEYQRLFKEYAYKRYKTFIDNYNQLLTTYNVDVKITSYLQTIEPSLSAKEFEQFKRDVQKELAPIKP